MAGKFISFINPGAAIAIIRTTLVAGGAIAAPAIAAMAYPVTIAPLEDLLLRYPHNSLNWAIGYRKLSEDNFAYFPNVATFLQTRKKPVAPD